MNRAPKQYEQSEQECLLEDYNNKIASIFCTQVVDAVEILVNEYAEHLQHREGSSAELLLDGFEQCSPKEIYDSICTFIVRLVVLLYAEDRGLLPLDNVHYLQNYSLRHLEEQLQGSPFLLRQGTSSAFAKIISIVEAIHSGIIEEKCSIFPHGGRLFFHEQSPIFKEPVDISDEAVHSILLKLCYIGNERIDYHKLYVENLGSMYELLMELHIEKGSGLALSRAKLRKDTGAHYTPRYLCDFIVYESLSHRLSEHPTSDEILQLRVCDPAMGSGAFLLSVCRIFGEKLSAAWARENHPNASLRDVQSKARCVIAKNCIFGVDINPSAVLLTKMSLWLESGASEESFDFMDHALLQGNGVLGLPANNDVHSVLGIPNTIADSIVELLHDAPIIAVHDVANILIGIAEKSIVEKLGVRKTRGLFTEFYEDLERAFNLSQSWSNTLLSPEFQDISKSVDSFHWGLRFSSVFENNGGFDMIVGNPPFINCIRGSLTRFEKDYLKNRFSYVTGSADISYYFLELASELIHNDGVIGLILPRVSMGADSLKGFRATPHLPKPSVLYSAEHYNFFAHANIKVVIYLFSKSSQLWVSNADMPMNAQWIEASIDDSSWWSAFKGNWWAMFWLALQEKSMPQTNDFVSICQLGFEVSGGLTTGDFYNINVEDQEQGEGLRLLTSGGIDPDVSFWGDKNHLQRFNKRRYQFPRIIEGDYDNGLQLKLLKSKRPKLIIANLTKEMEVFLDEEGVYQAATGTQTIYHRNDDVNLLQQLKNIMHSAYGKLLFQATLSYNAMHSNISVEKRFLEQFPIPENYDTFTLKSSLEL